jgi:hypothetical protein
MQQLIEAALEHAEYLRECALGDGDYGARVTIEEAQRWQELAKVAIDELAALRGH